MEKQTQIKRLSYRDFWENRGTQSVWFTEHVGYRFGAVVAALAWRMKISPNTISVASWFLTVGSGIAAAVLGVGSLLGVMVLFFGLQMGYIFDCADGLLARTAGQGSRFGGLLDKFIDLTSAIVLPWVLVAGLPVTSVFEIASPENVLVGAILVRTSLSMFIWIKELVLYDADRLRSDERRKTLWLRAKKTVVLYFDEPVYRASVAIAWVSGFFMEFLAIYHLGLLAILFLYVISSKREMDAADADIC